MKATIDRLQQKVEKLVERYRASEATILSLNQQLSSLQLQLEEKQNRISDLKEKNKILKLSASLQGKGEDTKATKQQINELVREVDKCIALLNK